jgi:hypothetical protein
MPRPPVHLWQIFLSQVRRWGQWRRAVQIRRILKPCAACGESLIFGDFAPEGDVLKLNEGWSRVRCPACRTAGPVRASFRDACESWNALAGSAQHPDTRSNDIAA